MKTTTAISLLLSTLASAATVTLKETPCIQNNTELQEFTIDTDVLVVHALESVCGLKIVSATTDVNAIVCQAFRDAAGTQKGSAEFTVAKPALISTNPVQEAAFFCRSGGDAATTGASTAAESTQSTGDVLTVTRTSILVLSTSASISTLSTSIAPSSGPLPSGGNATVSTHTGGPTSAPPTGTSTGASQPTGAAARAGLSVGALAGAFAMLLL